ncbi:MAG: cation diffusion facilitator family transporter [Bacteroidota bacterium]|nr:cation diffusion facilitator family transporter [Bacteroidota bacterium]MDP4225480.1 cation diffusion facilitator family transporter [Bacteroidota bacterium]MDP4274131.1 cation diffusion facilitator family transporter [Bacteroidota bacterium]
MKKKIAVARLSIISNSALIVLKLTVGIISGSVSIISESIHSTIDLLASLIAFFSVKISGTPPDKEHPYGHGKYENISGVIEGLLIFVAAIWIIIEAVDRFIHPKPVEAIGLGFIIMVIASAVNFFVSRKLYKVAKDTDSVALEADALHLKTDVYTALGVAAGLLIMLITKIHLFDPLLAIIMALLILKESYVLLKNAFSPLLDTSLPDEEVKLITSIINEENVEFHHLRTRKSGDSRFVDFHIELPEKTSLKDAHEKCDEIENSIKNKLDNIEITIHTETLEGDDGK